jgi:sensor c-di-GMP phosphodiesterase-like protein
MGDSEFNVMDEDVAMIIERKVETPNEQEVITEKIVTEEQPKINDILSNLLDEPKMDYKIVSSTDSDKLSSEVKENMVNDWIPHGGLCVTSTGVFFQAMVKIN